MKQDIRNREDIELLVNTFYSEVRKNDEIGIFFNTMIDDWDTHLNKLGDFWESMLFRVGKFDGNPALAHIKTATHFNHTIEKNHFETWLMLWRQTNKELFDGPISDLAVNRAEMIADVQLNMLERYKDNL